MRAWVVDQEVWTLRLAGRLVGVDFTCVGKKELERNPLMGPLGKVMDAAFIDRDDPLIQDHVHHGFRPELKFGRVLGGNGKRWWT